MGKKNNLSPEVLKAVISLHEHALFSSELEIIQEGIEYAVDLTKSQIGYFHLVNEDQETIELITWSKNTYNYCESVYDRHYPITQAGIWADCARLKKGLIHNNYQDMKNKKGYPEGHAHLERHMGAPVIKDNKIKVLAGVGNKKEGYTENDLEILQKILNKTWDLVEYRREVEAMKVHEVHLLDVKKLTMVSSWSYDVDENYFETDDMFLSIFEVVKFPENLENILNLINPNDHEKIRNTLLNPRNNMNFAIKVEGSRSSGHFKLLIKGGAKGRDSGKGYIYHGIIQDITENEKQKDLEKKAFKDPLTGLGNRNHLNAFLKRYKYRANRRPEDSFAIHFIDLDDFKPVNDNFGHLSGDRVLEEMGKRIEGSIRQDDIAVRLGGDEFVVLQTFISNEKQAEKLAEKLIKAISRPVIVNGIPIHIGASIGISLLKGSQFEIETILNEADQALYESKKNGKGRFTIFKGA